jgi:hypothetical protein
MVSLPAVSAASLALGHAEVQCHLWNDETEVRSEEDSPAQLVLLLCPGLLPACVGLLMPAATRSEKKDIATPLYCRHSCCARALACLSAIVSGHSSTVAATSPKSSEVVVIDDDNNNNNDPCSSPCAVSHCLLPSPCTSCAPISRCRILL